MYRKVITVSIFLCTLFSGCNSPTVKPTPVAATPTYQDDIFVTEEERAMLFSPQLQLDHSSDLQTTATCGNAAVIVSPNSATASRYYIPQQQVNFEYLTFTGSLSPSIRVINYLNHLKRALILEYGNTDQSRICWQGVNITGGGQYILTGKVFDIFVTLEGRCCFVDPTAPPNPRNILWTNLGVNLKYTYDAGRFEALVNVNLLTGWLTRVNKPAGSTSQVLDYPLTGYSRYNYAPGTAADRSKFSDMVSFKPIPAGTYKIQGLEDFGLAPMAVSNVGVNIPNTPQLSIKDTLANRGNEIRSRFLSICDTTIAYNPCPPPPAPPPVVTVTPPTTNNPTSNPTTCQQQNCGPKLGQAAFDTGLLVFSTIGAYTSYTAVGATCFTPVVVAVGPCAGSTILAAGATAGQGASSVAAGNSIGNWLACRQNNANCPNLKEND
jgi:hypothetical protein